MQTGLHAISPAERKTAAETRLAHLLGMEHKPVHGRLLVIDEPLRKLRVIEPCDLLLMQLLQDTH